MKNCTKSTFLKYSMTIYINSFQPVKSASSKSTVACLNLCRRDEQILLITNCVLLPRYKNKWSITHPISPWSLIISVTRPVTTARIVLKTWMIGNASLKSRLTWETCFYSPCRDRDSSSCLDQDTTHRGPMKSKLSANSMQHSLRITLRACRLSRSFTGRPWELQLMTQISEKTHTCDRLRWKN